MRFHWDDCEGLIVASQHIEGGVTNTDLLGNKWAFGKGRESAEKDQRIKDLEAKLAETHSPTQTFNIAFWTSPKKGAGTDAKVFTVLIGTAGRSKIEFVEKNEKNGRNYKFKEGTVDIFTIITPFIGKITQVHVGHNSVGTHPSWLLDRIEVADLASGDDAASFDCGFWLSKTEGDKQTDRKVEAWPRKLITRLNKPGSVADWEIILPPGALDEFTCNFMVRGAMSVIYEGKACEKAPADGVFYLHIRQNKTAVVTSVSGKYKVTLTHQPLMDYRFRPGDPIGFEYHVPANKDFTFNVEKVR